jgi:anti-sigma regulatory factor (Ser/Thr protein kinase)
VRHRYKPVSGACSAVRRDARAFLLPYGFAEDLVQDLLLVVTELVANAVDHARTAFSVTLTLVGRTVRIEVEDESVQPPRLRPPDPFATRGRGLQIVDALATAWTSTPHAHGKIVRAEIALG